MASEVNNIIKEFQLKKNFGYLPDVISDEDYILGGLQLPTEILQPNGQWDKFVPEDEIQRTERYETANCTAFGTLNALEFLFLRLFGEKKNWSERYVGIAAGTRPPGNSPQKVIEVIRKDCGLLNDGILPMSKANTIEEYYSPDPLPWLIKENGKKFIEDYKIGHEWLWSDYQQFNKAETLKNGLLYSPIGIAVFAWIKEGGLYIRPKGKEDNHWCVLYGYEEGKKWHIYDSYDSTIKYLDWNYEFFRAKRFYIEKIEKVYFWGWIKNFFKKYKINLFQ